VLLEPQKGFAVEAVAGAEARAALPDEPRFPQHAEMFGNGGLRKVDVARQVHAARIALGHRPDQLKPGRVTECAKHRRESIYIDFCRDHTLDILRLIMRTHHTTMT